MFGKKDVIIYIKELLFDTRIEKKIVYNNKNENALNNKTIK